MPGIDQAAARPRTLREHLIEQIGADLPDLADRVIAFHLLDQLDEAGYLRGGLEDAAERLGCPPARVERVLARLQEFDPPGVFARDLPECLALQLRDRNRLDPAMQLLLDNLPLLAARNAPALLRICGVDAEDLAEMVAEIKSLDPRPGHAFDPPLAQPVIPDIIMRAQPQGGWLVELNADTLPRVLVNNRYYARISQRRAQQGRARVSDRPAAGGELAGQIAAPARHHDPQGRDRDRAPAGRVFPPRRAGAAAADPARHRRCDRHAREHGQPGHDQQIHGDAARPVRAEVFLHLVDRRLARRRRRIRPRRSASASAA